MVLHCPAFHGPGSAATKGNRNIRTEEKPRRLLVCRESCSHPCPIVEGGVLAGSFVSPAWAIDQVVDHVAHSEVH